MANEIIYYCVGCGTLHPKGNFYVSYNLIHKNGRLPFCKDFIKGKVYTDINDVNVEKFKNILRQLDIPFLQDIFDSAINTGGDIVGQYFRQFNSLPQNRGLTWINSVFDEEAKEKYEVSNDDNNNKINMKDNIDDFNVTPDMVHRWGDSHTKTEVRDLEKFYRDMHMTHTIVTPQHEKALIFICKLQLKLDQCLENDDMAGFAKINGEYQKLLTSSGLRPIDKIGGAEASGIRSFSQIFEEIEKDGFIKPIPIKENQDIVDKTIQYILNYTLKLINKETLISPPIDTPSVEDDIDG